MDFKGHTTTWHIRRCLPGTGSDHQPTSTAAHFNVRWCASSPSSLLAALIYFTFQMNSTLRDFNLQDRSSCWALYCLCDIVNTPHTLEQPLLNPYIKTEWMLEWILIVMVLGQFWHSILRCFGLILYYGLFSDSLVVLCWLLLQFYVSGHSGLGVSS